MIKIDSDYTDYRDDLDPRYPYGKAVATSTPNSVDGTPWRALWFNDLTGARQAVFKKAFGNTRSYSNVPDNAENSDFLDALLKILGDTLASRLYVFEVLGSHVVIPWLEFGINYNPQKVYAVSAAPVGNYEDFMPIGTECQPDGLHIYLRRLVNGNIIPALVHTKWGTRKWGIGKWNDYGTMRISVQFAEAELHPGIFGAP